MADDLALLVNVADAVAARINAPGEGHAWCVDDAYDEDGEWDVQAVRAWIAIFDRKKLLPLHVRVLPGGIRNAGGSRTRREYECTVDVVVAKRVRDDSEVELLMKFIEEIGDLLAFGTLSWTGGSALWLGESQDPAYDRSEMEGKVFLAALTVRYKTMR